MQLAKKIDRAHDMLLGLGSADRNTVQCLCEDIKAAQTVLVRNALPMFAYCKDRCKGLCCRNISMETIITLVDMIFILAVDAFDRCRLRELAVHESFFPSNCLFLRDGQGPCLFPENTKPERCILTFCVDVEPVSREIKAVKSSFSKLHRYALIRRPWVVMGF